MCNSNEDLFDDVSSLEDFEFDSLDSGQYCEGVVHFIPDQKTNKL